MIFLKKIELNNFLSHSDTVLELKPNQKLLIDGVSGSGKSTVVDGLVWCLYGKARTANRSLIKSGTSTASVVVVLEDDDKSYRIVRSISSKGKHELEIFEKEPKAKTFKPSKVSGIKNLQDYLEKQILRSSYLLFINSIVYPQENVENFVRQPATKRKDLILEIINAGDYDEMLDKSKKALTDKRVAREVTKSRKDEKNSLFESLNELASNLVEYTETDKNKKAVLADIEEKLKVANDKMNEVQVRSMVYKEKVDRIEVAKKELNSLIEKEHSLNFNIGELKSLNVSELKSEVSNLPLVKAELERLYQQIIDFNTWNGKMMDIVKQTPASIDYDSQIDRVNKQIVAIMMEKIELCPELSKECPILMTKRNDRIAQMDSDVKRLKGEKEDLATLREEHKHKIEALGEAPILPENDVINIAKNKIALLETKNLKLKEFEVKISSIPALEKDLEETSKKISELTTEVNKFVEEKGESTKDDMQKACDEFNELNLKRAAVNIEISDNIAKLTLASEAARKLGRYKEDVVDLTCEEGKLDVEIEALETIKEALGPNGIRAIVIDLIIPQLEDKINNILSKLSEFRVKLETQKGGVGEKVVLEGLFINIINDQGEEFDFENYSGGERLKIVVAISEALSEVQKIGFRILDELFIGLDEESTEKFAMVMTSLQEKFQQMVCISHLRGIKDLFDDKITVTKINGNSKIT